MVKKQLEKILMDKNTKYGLIKNDKVIYLTLYTELEDQSAKLRVDLKLDPKTLQSISCDIETTDNFDELYFKQVEDRPLHIENESIGVNSDTFNIVLFEDVEQKNTFLNALQSFKEFKESKEASDSFYFGLELLKGEATYKDWI